MKSSEDTATQTDRAPGGHSRNQIERQQREAARRKKRTHIKKQMAQDMGGIEGEDDHRKRESALRTDEKTKTKYSIYTFRRE